jgi:KDO2-lipid IV(A) lauroyltransferase
LSQAEESWKDFLAPKYWGVWILLGILRIFGALPFAFGLKVGSGFGMLLYYLIKKRRKVTEVNVRLCFPEKNAEEQKSFVKDIFRANGIGFVETAWAYWGDIEAFRKRTTVIGQDILDKALAQGRGVIVLGAHFSNLDLGGVLISYYGAPVHCMYRKHNNPLMDYMIRTRRSRFTSVIDRKKIREVLRRLRDNHCIWYAPDQDFGEKGSVFVPFFGQTAATIVATTKFVAMNQSPMLMVRHQRNQDNLGYTIELSEVPNFPSGDETEDARIVNQTIEKAVRQAPEQYMWVHKRFKTQPDGRQKLYKQAGC